MQGKTILEISVGDKASFSKTITEHDVYTFAGVTGDFNPVHVNSEYAQGTMFKERIAHGILSAGLISTVVGTMLPGPGAIYASQSLKFLRPVHFGDTITAEAEVTDVLVEKNRVRLATRCLNQRGEIVAEGESLLLPRK